MAAFQVVQGRLHYKAQMAELVLAGMLGRVAFPTDVPNVVMIQPGDKPIMGADEWGAYWVLMALHDDGSGEIGDMAAIGEGLDNVNGDLTGVFGAHVLVHAESLGGGYLGVGEGVRERVRKYLDSDSVKTLTLAQYSGTMVLWA